MEQPKLKLSSHLSPGKLPKFLRKLEKKTHYAFHNASHIMVKLAASTTGTELLKEEETLVRPPEQGVECKKKKAVVVIGCLTDYAFSNQAYKNTANEAVSDFNDRGYNTTLLNRPTRAQLRALIADPCLKAFCYVGHGADSDSDNARVGDRGGGDTLWINCDDFISSSDIKKWINKGTMDIVILHACYQGASNTTTRWSTAFGVGAEGFYSWSGLCRYFTAFWWQFGWS